jgi:hypothetical protein
MKLLSQLASLSAAATLMLQLGTFVEASPFFTENAATVHSNAADPTQQCEGKHFLVFFIILLIHPLPVSVSV